MVYNLFSVHSRKSEAPMARTASRSWGLLLVSAEDAWFSHLSKSCHADLFSSIGGFGVQYPMRKRA